MNSLQGRAMQRRLLNSAFFAAGMFLLTACGGGSTGIGTVPPRPSPTASPAATTDAIFQIQIPMLSTSASATRLHPAYVSAATQSLSIALNGKTIATADVSPTSKNCAAPANGSRTCSVGINATAGNDVFTVTAYDGPNGTGDVLSSGEVSATIATSNQTVVKVAMDGTPVAILLSLQSPYLSAGTTASTNVIVQELDAQGNTIMGTYAQAVTLKDADTSGATQLSSPTIASSSSVGKLSYNGAPFMNTTITASASGLATATAIFTVTPTLVADYQIPGISGGGPIPFPPVPAGISDLCVGPDGNIWVDATSGGAIEKISPNGTVTTYALPNPAAYPGGLVVGPDHNLWFVERLTGAVAKITTSGVVTEYPIPGAVVNTFHFSGFPTVGSDGNIWVAYDQPNVLLKVTTSGTITSYSLRGSTPLINELVSGPDGNLWLTDEGDNAIEVMSTSGALVATYPLPRADSRPWGITVGPDKNIWFTEENVDRIGRITTSGTLHEFPVPTAFSGTLNIATGPDGNLWFAESGGYEKVAGKFGYISPDGSTIRDFTTKDGNHVHNLVFDANKNLWITQSEIGLDEVGKVIY
jgi:streptogramin lyase